MPFCLLLWTGSLAYAALLDASKRVVDGRTVDLTPLFHWWTNQHGPRPLGSWVRLGGTIKGTNALGWVIQGCAEKSVARAAGPHGGSSKPAVAPDFVLRNPPVEEAAEFERLHEQLQRANAERARVRSEVAGAKTQEALVQKGTRGRARAIATGRLRRVETADNRLAKSLDSQISELKKKLSAYPNSDRYQADAIALDTGTEYNHLPVYDHGVPLK